MDWLLLHIMLLPRLPFMGFQNVLSTIMGFYTVLLLTRELSSQAEIYDIRPKIIESTCLTMVPTVLKHLACRKMERSFEGTILAPIMWQQLGGLGQGFPEGSICIESVSNIWYNFSHSRIHGSTHYHL